MSRRIGAEDAEGVFVFLAGPSGSSIRPPLSFTPCPAAGLCRKLRERT